MHMRENTSWSTHIVCHLISMIDKLMLCIWEKTQVDLLILSVIWFLWLINSCYAHERKHKLIYSYCLSFNLYNRCSLISMINELMLFIWEKTQVDLLMLSVIWSLWLMKPWEKIIDDLLILSACWHIINVCMILKGHNII